MFKEGKDADIPAHAKTIAKIYDKFAKTVLDFSGDKVVSGLKSDFEKTLTPLLNSPANTAATVGLAYEAACVKYWINAQFGKVIPPPGLKSEISVVHTPHLAGPVAALITASILNPSPDPVTKGTLWAAAFEKGVKTINVTITGLDIVLNTPVTVGPLPVQ